MKTLFCKKIFLNSRSDFAKARSAIYSVSSKAVMIKQCNAITTKYEFSLYRKAAKIELKKNGSEKLIKSPRNRLAGALTNKPLVRFIYTCIVYVCKLCLKNHWVTLHPWVCHLKCSLCLLALPKESLAYIVLTDVCLALSLKTKKL